MRRIRRSLELGRMVGAAERENRCIVAGSTADRQRLYRAVKAGKLISPLKGLYVRPELWNDLGKEEQAKYLMKGLQHRFPGWIFAGRSAALVHGLWVSHSDLLPLQIAVSKQKDGRPGSLAKRITIEDDPFAVVDGLRVTSFERTVFDCLRSMDFAHGLAIADSALREKKWDLEHLKEVVEGMPHRCKGWAAAMNTASFADPRAESGGESIARARMLLFGYEPPDLQVPLSSVVDGDSYRGDFGWHLSPNELLIGELDGHEKYTNAKMTKGRSVVDVLTDERLRESRMSAPGVRIMRFSYKEMMDDARFVKILDSYGVPKVDGGLTSTDKRHG